jgi:predicted  nucleic acid-binding Zn-ribbon protein
MQQEVEALLALQTDDAGIRELEKQLNALDPELADLDRRREQAAAAVARAQGAAESEEKRQREIQSRLAQHKVQQERNLAQLDEVKRLKEATAAMAQVETTKRMMAEDESEVQACARRLTELHAAVSSTSKILSDVEAEQETARSEIGEKKAALNEKLAEARAVRDKKSAGVPRPLLAKYDRIRGRRPQALFSLREGSCGNCDTAIPLQRRNMMHGTGQIEVCEACGVLLYSESA